MNGQTDEQCHLMMCLESVHINLAGKTRQLDSGREKGERGAEEGARREKPELLARISRVLESGETSHLNPSQGNPRQDFKEGKNPHIPLPSPWKTGLTFLNTDTLGHT